VLLQICGARFCGAGLREDASRCALFGLGLFGLQPKVDFVERRQGLAGNDPGTNVN
jgi:hypothetical protein